MGRLFSSQVDLYKQFSKDIKKEYDTCAIIEVGMGTAELFSKVYEEYDLLVGVELS